MSYNINNISSDATDGFKTLSAHLSASCVLKYFYIRMTAMCHEYLDMAPIYIIPYYDS